MHLAAATEHSTKRGQVLLDSLDPTDLGRYRARAALAQRIASAGNFDGSANALQACVGQVMSAAQQLFIGSDSANQHSLTSKSIS